MSAKDSSESSGIDSLIQISSGNIPSQAAHSIQIVKMAGAFSKRIKRFELITSGDIHSILKRTKIDLIGWYGLSREISLVRVPTRWYQRYPFPKDYYGGILFYLLSAIYTWYRSPSLVYTRTPAIVKILLMMSIPVMWELHEIAKENVFKEGVLSHEKLIGFVTTSRQLGEIAVNKGLPSEKLFIETNAVDIEKFLPYQSRQSARAKISWAGKQPLVVYSGHLYDYKGIPTILGLAEVMPYSDFMLVGGWPSDIDRVRALCHKRKLTNVYLIGHVSQSAVPDYLYAADILILPTSGHWEQAAITSPLKLFDYMAAKRPIVASDLPNIATIAHHQINALLAEPDNLDSFRNAIDRILKDKFLGKALAQRASEDALKNTWDHRAERILNFAEGRLMSLAESTA